MLLRSLSQLNMLKYKIVLPHQKTASVCMKNTNSAINYFGPDYVNHLLMGFRNAHSPNARVHHWTQCGVGQPFVHSSDRGWRTVFLSSEKAATSCPWGLQ